MATVNKRRYGRFAFDVEHADSFGGVELVSGQRKIVNRNISKIDATLPAA